MHIHVSPRHRRLNQEKLYQPDVESRQLTETGTPPSPHKALTSLIHLLRIQENDTSSKTKTASFESFFQALLVKIRCSWDYLPVIDRIAGSQTAGTNPKPKHQSHGGVFGCLQAPQAPHAPFVAYANQRVVIRDSVTSGSVARLEIVNYFVFISQVFPCISPALCTAPPNSVILRHVNPTALLARLRRSKPYLSMLSLLTCSHVFWSALSIEIVTGIGQASGSSSTLQPSMHVLCVFSVANPHVPVVYCRSVTSIPTPQPRG